MKTNQYISRVEGHGNLKIDFNKNQAQVIVEENERLFEQLVVNYSYERAPFITARICGICPTAHYLASIKAIESAFDVKPTENTIKLRELLLAAQIVQSHTLHLFFLVLPDYTKSQTVKNFAQNFPAEFHLGLTLKKLSDKIVNLIGGREVHPLTPTVGGFKKLPSYSKIKALANDIAEALDEAQDAVRLFDKIKYPEIQQQDFNYLNLKKDDHYPLYQAEDIAFDENHNFKVEDYDLHIIEQERAGTLVKFSHLKHGRQKKNIMVGALARLNNSSYLLNPIAQQMLSKSQLNIPSTNPFDNIKAQAIEVLHYLEQIKDIIDGLTEQDMKNSNVKVIPKASHGVGAVEAPRGVLYHYYKFNKQGQILKADIIPPTSQNMLGLENDADQLIQVYEQLSQAKKEQLVEQLVRAYDPCLTCSVH